MSRTCRGWGPALQDRPGGLHPPSQRQRALTSLDVDVVSPSPAFPLPISQDSTERKQPRQAQTHEHGQGAVEAVLGDGDMLSHILPRVAEATGRYTHALVCKKWLAVAPSFQVVVRVREGAELGEAQVLQQLGKFAGRLTTLCLLPQSVHPLTDFFLGAASCTFPLLRRLTIRGDFDPEASASFSADGLSSFFHHCPRLHAFTCTRAYTSRVFDVPPVALPPSVSKLTSLTSLEFGICSSLPPSLGTLTSLQRLTLLGWSQGPGVLLPDSITGLSLLTSLSLSHLRMLPPDLASHLPHLLSLTLHSCSPPDLPPSVTQLSLLESLEVSSGDMVRLPDDMERLSSLRCLSLHKCLRLRSLPPSLCHLRHLHSLSLCSCDSLHELPGGWGRLRELRSLDIAQCSSLSSLPPSMGRLPRLQHLSLSRLPLLRRLPPDLTGLQSLQLLDLVDMGALDSLPPSLCRLPHLHILRISHCPRLRSLPPSVLDLPSLCPLSKALLRHLVDSH